MRLSSAITFLLAACAISATKVAAQSTNAAAVLTVAVNLTGYIQQPTNSSPLLSVKTQKFTTKDIIGSIESDLGLPTNDLATAKLLLRFGGLGDTNHDATLHTILRT